MGLWGPGGCIEGVRVGKGKYLLVVGRLEPENNADLVIRAFQKVSTDKLLVVVGGTNGKSSYSRRLKKIDDQRVRFLGAIYQPGHLNQLLEGCYFYVHGHEVGGTNPALLQAMGSNSCVLALNTVFNAEVIGGAGLLFAKDAGALADKIRYLLVNPEVVRYYREAGPGPGENKGILSVGEGGSGVREVIGMRLPRP